LALIVEDYTDYSCQHSCKVESKFQTFYRRVSATLNNGGLEDCVRTGVWAECARTAIFRLNITSIKAKDKCPHQIMLGSKTKLSTSLRILEKWAYSPPNMTYKES
jgi:hypothetical protein